MSSTKRNPDRYRPRGVEAPAARRQPLQQRSRERVERILAAACELIAQAGSDALKMNDIASRAGISIGSLYQYFPDKRAIIRTLAAQYAAESRRCIEEALAPVRSRAGLDAAFAALVDRYHALFQSQPVMCELSAGMRADKELAAAELAESRACGALLAAAIRRAHPKAEARRVEALAFLLWQLGEETMRLAIAHEPRDGDLLVQAYKHMGRRALAAP